MRAVLSTLLCIIFLESQALAVHQRHFNEGGGPVPDVVGTYAGVLLPGTVSSSDTSSNENSIGVFSLSVPSSGLGSGTFVAFSGGRQFNGTIDAVADPDSGAVDGVLQATFNFTLTRVIGSSNGIPIFKDFTITATLSGSLEASAVTNTVTTLDATTPSLARLEGTASLELNFGGVNLSDFSPIITNTLDFTVIGFKQDSGSSSSTTTGG